MVITKGRFKYLIYEDLKPVRVKILKDGLQHQELKFPTAEHAFAYINQQFSLD